VNSTRFTGGIRNPTVHTNPPVCPFSGAQGTTDPTGATVEPQGPTGTPQGHPKDPRVLPEKPRVLLERPGTHRCYRGTTGSPRGTPRTHGCYRGTTGATGVTGTPQEPQGPTGLTGDHGCYRPTHLEASIRAPMTPPECKGSQRKTPEISSSGPAGYTGYAGSSPEALGPPPTGHLMMIHRVHGVHRIHGNTSGSDTKDIWDMPPISRKPPLSRNTYPKIFRSQREAPGCIRDGVYVMHFASPRPYKN